MSVTTYSALTGLVEVAGPGGIVCDCRLLRTKVEEPPRGGEALTIMQDPAEPLRVKRGSPTS